MRFSNPHPNAPRASRWTFTRSFHSTTEPSVSQWNSAKTLRFNEKNSASAKQRWSGPTTGHQRLRDIMWRLSQRTASWSEEREREREPGKDGHRSFTSSRRGAGVPPVPDGTAASPLVSLTYLATKSHTRGASRVFARKSQPSQSASFAITRRTGNKPKHTNSRRE